jgi:hypothetical protein
VEAKHPQKDDSVEQTHQHRLVIPRPIPDSRYRAFADQFDVKSKTTERERVCYDAHVDLEANVVTDDESDGNDGWGGSESDDETVAVHNTERRRDNEENLSDLVRNTPSVKTRPAAIVDEDLENLSCQYPQIEMLRWHYRLDHLSFQRIKRMAELGILPKNWPKSQHPSVQAVCLML